jgi:hypothetical protein
VFPSNALKLIEVTEQEVVYIHTVFVNCKQVCDSTKNLTRVLARMLLNELRIPLSEGVDHDI